MIKVPALKRISVLTLLFAFAFILRFSFISKGPFHYDTLDLAISAQKTLDSFHLHYEHLPGYPLTVIFGAFFIFILRFLGLNDPVFSMNFMSVVMGACDVLAIFLLVERLFDFNKAVFSGLLLACFMPHVAISTFGKSFTLGIFLSLLSATFMLRYAQEKKGLYLILSALFLGLCAAARLSDVLCVVPIAWLLFSAEKLPYGKAKSFVVFILMAGLIALIFYLPLLFENGLLSGGRALVQQGQSEFLGVFSPALRQTLCWIPRIMMLSGIVLLLVGSGIMIFKKQGRPFIFLFLWFLVLQVFNGNLNAFAIRYLVIAWIPLLIAEGYLLGFLKGKGFYLSLFVFLVVAVAGFVKSAPALAFRHNYALQVDFARWVAKKTEPDAVIIAVDEGIMIEFYGKRTILERPVACDKNTVNDFFNNKIDPMLNRGRNIYIISSAIVSYYCGIFEEELSRHYDLILIGSRYNEDWHHVLLYNFLKREKLFQLRKK
jgi:hypothetical protein